MSTCWSVILNRIDNALGNPPWKEWRASVVSVSSGAADAGAIPMLGPDGQLDPSMIPTVQPPVIAITLTAGANVNAFQAVSVHADGLAYPADASTLSDAGAVVGIALTSATTGNTLNIQQAGKFINNGYNFTPGVQTFLGLSGTLVDSLPVGAVFQQPMGTAINSTSLLLEVGLPIILS